MADDKTILDDWRLLRRIPIGGSHPHIIWDDNIMCWVVSSMAFNGHPDNPKAFSVHLEPVLVEYGISVAEVIIDVTKFALIAFTAGEARQQRQDLERAALPGEPAHAHVIGDKTGSVRKALKRCAVWVVPPPPSIGETQ
jgi:hypothetical protein